jgi:hypothetical protein
MEIMMEVYEEGLVASMMTNKHGPTEKITTSNCKIISIPLGPDTIYIVCRLTSKLILAI